MPTDPPKKNDVIFFFGAGASVDAGIPDTYSFVEAFEEYVKEKYSQLFQSFSMILKKREEFNKRNGLNKQQVDVEQLLDILRRIIGREKEPLLDLYEEKQFCSSVNQSDCLELKTLLENFIREKVIIDDEKKLEYLKELLNFDTPIEIYSTNYDTCIEQLSYLNHRRYTDGFDIYWDEKNFDEDFDVKHYKMHGSVIWYENIKTKQCIKIPANAFVEGKPVELKLIYGESVKPLLLYPAQKAEYIEPLTDLQLMFKKRLFDEMTKFAVFVGYSFRDDYVVHMLWDAARVNENLHVILISPNATEIFEDKLKYIDKEQKGDLSRIHDRVLCLPYPFGTAVYQLKNHYLHKLENIVRMERDFIQTERLGGKAEWQNLLRMCIEDEFLSKAEYILEEKLHKDWNELNFDAQDNKIQLSFRGLMHSVIAKDDYTDRWLRRFNDSLEFLNTENLRIHPTEQDFYIFFEYQKSEYLIGKIISTVESLLTEKTNKLRMLSPSFEFSLNSISESLKKLEKLKNYLDTMKTRINWQDYLTLRNDVPEKATIEKLSSELYIREPQNIEGWQTRKTRLNSLILTVERRELEKIFGGKTFQAELDDAKK